MTSSPSTSDPTAPVTTEGETFPSQAKRLEYLPVEVPEPGDYAEVAPGILWLRIPMPMDLNHINLWLLEDGDGWTLVDSGFNAPLCRETWEKLEAKLFSQRPLKRIFLTHLHPDHVGLARWLQDRHRVPVWMSARGIELLKLFAGEQNAADLAAAEGFMRNNGFNDSELVKKFFSGVMFRLGISGVPDFAYEPRDGESVAIGNTQWELYETNGHAEGHQCLSDAERKILISGDQVLPTISSNVSFNSRGGDRNPLRSYLESLERLSQLDTQTLVLPSHGRPFFGLQARAADLIAHHREHLQAMTDACVEPKTAFDLVPVLFKRRLVGTHWMFAMGETIAHAEYLAIAGQLVRQTNGEGMIRYARS